VQQNENECHSETVKAIGEEVVERCRGHGGSRAGGRMGMQEVVRWRLAVQEQAAIGCGRRGRGAGLGTVSGAAALSRA
jgi:hypothetical protein